MKKFAFLTLLLLLYYIAGMYDSPALMMLFLTQLLFRAVSCLFCSADINLFRTFHSQAEQLCTVVDHLNKT